MKTDWKCEGGEKLQDNKSVPKPEWREKNINNQKNPKNEHNGKKTKINLNYKLESWA